MSEYDPGQAPPDDGDLTAAEYVIGLLTPAEAREVEVRAIGDPALAAAILEWQQRLHPMTMAVLPVRAPDSVWTRLEAKIGPQPAVQAQVSRPERRGRRYMRRVGRRAIPRQMKAAWMFAGGMIGAACMAAFLSTKMLVMEPAVAALVPVGAPMPAFWVMVTKDGYATVIAGAADVQPGNSLELWGVVPGGTVPVSLGVVPTEGRLKMPAIVPAGTTLLVSSEPKGGSPTGAPTGPVVYKGRMVKG